MKEFYKSKKFWAAMIAAVLPVVCRKLGVEVTAKEMEDVRYVIMTYIIGQGVADAGIYHASISTSASSEQFPDVDTNKGK